MDLSEGEGIIQRFRLALYTVVASLRTFAVNACVGCIHISIVGHGVHEIRVRDESGAFRVIYITKFAEAVYVLHAFQKKTRKTSKSDLDQARDRLNELLRSRK